MPRRTAARPEPRTRAKPMWLKYLRKAWTFMLAPLSPKFRLRLTSGTTHSRPAAAQARMTTSRRPAQAPGTPHASRASRRGVEPHPVVPGLLREMRRQLQPQLPAQHPAQAGEVGGAHLAPPRGAALRCGALACQRCSEAGPARVLTSRLGDHWKEVRPWSLKEDTHLSCSRECSLAHAQASLQPGPGCTAHHSVGSASSSGAVACAQAPHPSQDDAQRCTLAGMARACLEVSDEVWAELHVCVGQHAMSCYGRKCNMGSMAAAPLRRSTTCICAGAPTIL